VPLSRAARTPGVRLALPGDLDAIETLENKAFSADQLSRRSLARYIRAPSAALIVAELGVGDGAGPEPALGGYALIGLRKGGRVANLYSICVDPDLSGRGIGKVLMRALEDEARRRGRDSVTLEVRLDNSGAIALYEKLGYERFGEYDDYYEDGQSALRMRKRLA
jgi:ribosomal protein S18 acetylase RimI-like enzyme